MSGGVLPGFRGTDVAHKPARARIAVLAWLMVFSLTVALIEPRAVGTISGDAFAGLVAFINGFSDGVGHATTAVATSVEALTTKAASTTDTGPVTSDKTSPLTGTASKAAPTTASTGAATLALTPTAGRIGTELMVSGFRFPSGQPVLITWDGAVIGSQPVTPDGTGSFQRMIMVPAASLGTHTLGATARSNQGGDKQNLVIQLASAVFMVAATAAVTNQPITSSVPLPTSPILATPVPTTAPAPTAAPAPTTASAPTSAPTATAAPAPSSPAAAGLDVKTFGAVGNGLTDDTAAIHRARDAAGVGGTVRFPSGTFLVADLRANVEDQLWQLDPAATLQLKPAGGGVLSISANSVRVIGGHIDGRRASQTSSGTCVGISGQHATIASVEVFNCLGWGIYAYGSDYTTISDSSVHDTGAAAIFAENGIHHILISGNTVGRTIGTGAAGIAIHSQQGTAGAGSANEILNNRVTDSAQIAIELWSPNSRASGNTTVGGDIGISVGGADGTTISSNVVSGARQYGIEFGNGAGGFITGNTVDCNNQCVNVIIDDQGYATTIANNTLRRGTRGVQLSVGTHNNTITNNTIETWTRFAIESSASEYASISGNSMVANGGLTGVSLANSSNSQVTRNTIKGVTYTAVGPYGYGGYVVDNLNISDNRFESCAAPITESGTIGTHNVYQNNYIGP